MKSWADWIAIGVAAIALVILLTVIRYWIIHGGVVIYWADGYKLFQPREGILGAAMGNAASPSDRGQIVDLNGLRNIRF